MRKNYNEKILFTLLVKNVKTSFNSKIDPC